MALPGAVDRAGDLVLDFAGHASILADRDSFFPRGMDVGAGGAGGPKSALPIEEIADHFYLPSTRAKHRIIILDISAAGRAADDLAGPGRLARTGAEFDAVSRDTGQIMIMASSATGKAQESDLLGHGVLTYTPLAGMGAVAVGPLKDYPITTFDQEVGAREWFQHARQNVIKMTSPHAKGVEADFGLLDRQGVLFREDPYYADKLVPLFVAPARRARGGADRVRGHPGERGASAP